MKSLILAGGGGTRLWPVSRQRLPKQFLDLGLNPATGGEGTSLLSETIYRCSDKGHSQASDAVFIVTSALLLPQVQRELQRIGLEPLQHNVICEPLQRNTAPAIALAAQFIQETTRCPDNEVLVIAPADHVIGSAQVFQEHVQEAAALAREGHIVTMGIRPTRPETGYGYIEIKPNQNTWHTVLRFVEKPNFETAQQYVASQRFLWNAGIFVLTFKTLRAAFREFSPAIAAQIKSSFQQTLDSFEAMPNISFDCAVMEQARNVAVIPMRTEWSDVGSWDSVMELYAKNPEGNVIRANQAEVVGSRNCMVWSDAERLIATIGIEDCLIIDTPDVLLVARRGETQRVREVVTKLQAASVSHAVTPTRQQESWGSLERLNPMDTAEISLYRLVFKPGQAIQLQTDTDIQWSVLGGEANWTDGESTQSITVMSTWQQKAGVNNSLLTSPAGTILMAMGPLPEVRLMKQDADYTHQVLRI